MGFLADLPWERVIASGLFFCTAVLIAAFVVKFLPKALSKIPSEGVWWKFTAKDDERGNETPRSTPAESDDPPSVDADLPPVINVMVLGLEGFGKTMMMAGMYYRWAFGGRHGVVLKADEATVEFLSRIVARINDPDGGLPDSTREGDIVRAAFTFMVDIANDGVRRSFRLRYVDYPGEYIRRVLFHSGSSSGTELRRDLDEADILLGVLDGGQIARAMRGDPPPDFANVLAGLMLYLANVEKKTTHIVVSKWDLLVDDNGDRYPLSSVIEFLNTYPPFYQFYQNSPAIGVRRIIPISTFGLNGFIKVDDDGTVHKDPTVPWQPFMAENTVACSVPDVIETEFKRALEEYHAEGQAGRGRRSIPLGPLLKVALSVLNSVTGIRIIHADGITYEELAAAWREWTDRTGRRPGQTENSVSGAESSRPEAILRVLQLFAESVRELEREFPESKIRRRRPPGRRQRGGGNRPAGRSER